MLKHLDLFRRDLRYGVRSIRRSASLSLAVVLTLVVGVGMNSVVFSLFNGLLFRPAVTRDPDSYVQIHAHVSGQWTREFQGPPSLVTLEDFETVRDRARTLSAVTVSRWMSFMLGEGEAAPMLRGRLVSCDFLSAHVGAMRLGRGLMATDCAAAGGERVLVLTERAWTLHFARDPAAIGRVIRLNGQPMTIVGVAPDDAVGEPLAAMVYVPYTMQPVLQGPIDYFREPHARHAWLSLSGRLRPEHTIDQAQAELQLLARTIDRLHPGQVTGFVVTDGALIHQPGTTRTLPLLIGLSLGTTTLILAMVCANVTTLLLARAVARRPEMAVRAALGASRGQLVQQLLIEPLLLGGGAAAVSVVLANFLPWRLAQSLTDFPLLDTFAPDWRVLGFTFGLSFLAACVAGLSPAREALRVSVSGTSRVRGTLVANQLSISLAMLIAVALIVRAQQRVLDVKLDFDPATTIVTSIDLGRYSYSGPAARAFYDRLLPELEALPGVHAVALSSPPPFSIVGRKALRLDGSSVTLLTAFRAISPSYFDIIGLRAVKGRLFTDAETRAIRDPMPVVVSESFANASFPGAECLGRRLRFGNDDAAVIIGVVRDTVSVRPTERDEPMIYQPIYAANVATVTPVLQVTGDARAVNERVRAAIRSIDPRLIARTETIATAIARDATQYVTVMKLTSVPAAVALFLALVGIYGVTAFAAAQRTQEIGVRIACGARTPDVVRLFLHSLRAPFLAGVLGGSVLAAVGVMLLKWTRLTIHVSPSDPLAYATAIALLTCSAAVATLIPAIHAARKDPWSTLRSQ